MFKYCGTWTQALWYLHPSFCGTCTQACGTCTQSVANNVQHLQCSICKLLFHKKIACSFKKLNELHSVLSKISEWICHQCMLDTIPICNLEKANFLNSLFLKFNIKFLNLHKTKMCLLCEKG